MSSSEQAPEPTMDEILASIRKIISDDEQGEPVQPESAAAAQDLPADTGQAASMNDSQPVTGGLDDILELTEAIEGRAPGTETTPETAAPPPPPPADTPHTMPGAASDDAGDINIAELLAEAGVENTLQADAPAPDPAMETQAPADAGFPAAPGPAADQGISPMDEPSITEALSSIDQPEPDALMADTSMTEHEPALPPAPETADPVKASIDTGVYTPPADDQPAGLDDLVGLPELSESSDEAAGQDAPPIDHAAGGEQPLQADTWGNEPDVSAVAAPAASEQSQADEPAPMEEAAAAPANSAGKTLEDSIKDMLRPILRDWLDDNMERIVSDTVKDEIASGNIKRS